MSKRLTGKSERRLRELVLETIPYPVWWKGTDLRYVSYNQSYLRWRGVPDGVPGDELGSCLDRAELAVLKTGQGVIDVKISVEDGVRILQFSVLPCLDGDELVGVMGVGADISRITELERLQAQANRLEAIGQLAAGIAHEINTPVQYASDNTRFVTQAVADLLDALRELDRLVHESGDAAGGGLCGRVAKILEDLDLDFVVEEVPSALSQSLEGLERVTQIVRAMKEFSHPGQGRTEADLNRLVTSTMQVSRNEWKYVAELELDLDPTVGNVSCYEGDLKQAVLNIIVNAAHAVEERRKLQHLDPLGQIVVATRRANGEARITITDDGIGMDDPTRQRIFDPFFTTKEVGRGTGQGLALARAAMKKHGGRVEVVSKLGEGSTFSLVFPLPDVPADDVAGKNVAASGAGARETDRRAVR